MLKCPSCSGIPLTPEGVRGEKVCSNCGLVINNNYIVPMFAQWNPEWYSNWKTEEPESLKDWLIILRTVSCQLKESFVPCCQRFFETTDSNE